MATTREKLVLSVVLALAFACRLDKLLETPRPPGLGVAPSSVAESAPAGSGEVRAVALRVSSSPSRVITWTAHSEGDSAWLALLNPAGTTPDTLQVELNSSGLSPGIYRETIVVVPDDSAAPSVRVPVELRINAVQPTTGNLEVRVGTTGATPDPDGYTVTIDGGQSRTLAVNDTTVYTDLIAQSHTVQLGGLASNCTVSGAGATRSVPVSAGQTATVTYAVNCPTTPPPTGDLTVRTTTTGAAPDPDGYSVTIDGGQSRALGVNDSTTYTLAASSYTVQLGGVAANCTVSGGASRPVTVSSGQTARAAFAVDCPAAAATRLVFGTQPTTTTAGATITPAVQVRAVDAQGTTITTFTGTVSLTIGTNPGGGTLAGNTSASAVAGVANFPGLSINRSGNGYTLAAHASGLADGVSDAFAINPGAPDHLVFTVQPSNTTVNRPIAPAVRVTMLDINGNVATSFTGIVFMNIDHDGALVPPATLAAPGTQRAAAAGVATFEDLRIDKVGVGYTLVASATSLKGGFSDAFDVTPIAGSATRQSFFTPPSSVEVNQVMSPVRVEALDGNGARVTSYTGTITLALAPNPGALSGTTSTNMVSGLATFSNLVVTQMGTGYRLTAQASDLPDVTSAAFTVNVPPPPPTGDLTVTVSTTGGTPDPDGYTVTVDGGQSRGLGINESTTYAGLAAGSHSVQLNGLASNCSVSNNPRSVNVPSSGTGSTTFSVGCPTPPPPPNQAPTVNAGPDQTAVLAVLFSPGASFSDPDNGPWSYTIDWGDGSSSSGNASSPGAIGGTHTYLLTGSYRIRVTVSDSGGGTGSDEMILTVIL